MTELTKGQKRYQKYKTLYKEYYQANKKKIIAHKREYYKKNKKRIDEYKRNWVLRNPDKVKQYGAKKRKNPKYKERQKEYRLMNKEKIQEYNRKYHPKYYADNKKRIRDYRREYKMANKERLCENNRRYSQKIREGVMQAYGGKCVCCGESELDFLTIDHINGDGNQQRKDIRSGKGFYIWLRDNNYPKKNFQILCRNCNYGKYINNGICPHQTVKIVKKVS